MLRPRKYAPLLMSKNCTTTQISLSAEVSKPESYLKYDRNSPSQRLLSILLQYSPLTD